jgi:PAS domain S-box-containing protein
MNEMAKLRRTGLASPAAMRRDGDQPGSAKRDHASMPDRGVPTNGARRSFGEDTIRVRLLRLAVLLLLPGLSLAAVATWRSYQTDQTTTEAAMKDTARGLAIAVEGRIEQAETLLKAIASSGELSTSNIDQFNDFASAAADVGSDLTLRDSLGNVLMTVAPQPLLPSNLPTALPLGNGFSLRWLPGVAGGPGRVLMVSMSVAAFGAPGGSLSIDLPPERLATLLSALHLQEDWAAAIYNSDRRPAVCSVNAGPLCVFPADNAASPAAARNRPLYAMDRAPHAPVLVAVLSPPKSLTGGSGLSLLLLVSEGAGLITLGLLGALLVASGISQPVEALAGAARHLGETDTLPQIPGRLLEADEVARAMRTANRALLERRAALADTNASLATAVQVRTAELAEVNRALEEQRTQLDLILDHMPVGVVVHQVDGTLMYANPEARRLMGMPRKDEGTVVNEGLGVQLFRDAQPISVNKAPPARARRGVVTERDLLVMQRPDGTKLDIEVSAGPIRDSFDHVALSVTTIQDVSARLEAEEARRRSQRLEAVGQLTGGVAHEFNNLLMAVSGCLDLLAPYVRGDRARSLLESAARATDRGGRLTRQLLAFARRQNLHSEPVDLSALVAGMKELLASTLGRSIEIVTETDTGGWHAMADAPQLELVLLNLAINARDAMHGGGRLVIGTGNATLGQPRRAEEPPAGDYAYLRVSDNGQGMSPDVLNRVFEPFFTTKEVGRGSGLGLPQVLGVAQQLGGGVIIDSAAGIGTTVSVFLPRAATEAVPQRRATLLPPAPRALQGVRMLLVDDDDEVRQVAHVMLEEMGALVTSACSGEEALLHLQTDIDIDLMLADFTMPQMTGIELAHEVRRKLPDLPVVLMTGYSAAAFEDSSPDIFEILQKPFRAEALAETLLRALGDWTPPAPASGRGADMPLDDDEGDARPDAEG